MVFLRVLPFLPHLLIGPVSYELNNLEKDVKLNKKNKNEIEIARIMMYNIACFISRISVDLDQTAWRTEQ